MGNWLGFDLYFQTLLTCSSSLFISLQPDFCGVLTPLPVGLPGLWPPVGSWCFGNAFFGTIPSCWAHGEIVEISGRFWKTSLVRLLEPYWWPLGVYLDFVLFLRQFWKKTGAWSRGRSWDKMSQVRSSAVTKLEQLYWLWGGGHDGWHRLWTRLSYF